MSEPELTNFELFTNCMLSAFETSYIIEDEQLKEDIGNRFVEIVNSGKDYGTAVQMISFEFYSRIMNQKFDK